MALITSVANFQLVVCYQLCDVDTSSNCSVVMFCNYILSMYFAEFHDTRFDISSSRYTIFRRRILECHNRWSCNLFYVLDTVARIKRDSCGLNVSVTIPGYQDSKRFETVSQSVGEASDSTRSAATLVRYYEILHFQVTSTKDEIENFSNFPRVFALILRKII